MGVVEKRKRKTSYYLLWSGYVPGSVLSTSYLLHSLILTGVLGGSAYMDFTDEMLRTEIAHWVRGRFRPGLSDS